MSLLICPECGKEISDKAEACPHCGLPAKHFTNTLKHNQRNQPGIKKVWENLTKIRRADGEERSHAILSGFDPKEFRNALISFDRDYEALFSTHEYIDTKNIALFKNNYEKYFKLLDNKLIFQYLITNATALQIDEISLNRFYNKMQHVTQEVEQFNNSYVDKKLVELKDYFDHIMDNIDPNIKLDEEQRRAVITDDNHCLLVAGAGAGKTTTMAAKVKYLVEKQKVNPKDIIVISYTNKAVNELKDRINKSLKIPA
jgi:DNA helicase-4